MKLPATAPLPELPLDAGRFPYVYVGFREPADATIGPHYSQWHYQGTLLKRSRVDVQPQQLEVADSPANQSDSLKLEGPRSSVSGEKKSMMSRLSHIWRCAS